MQVERVELGELADEVAEHLGVLAEENGQSISVRRSASATCDVDRLVLRQALVNLVDNAIKYSPADSEIAIRTFASDAEVVLEVSNAGAGIAPDRGARIFDRHYRAEAGGRGAGLGLAIAKWAVEVNRGQLTLAAVERRQHLPHDPAARDRWRQPRCITEVRLKPDTTSMS